MSIRDVTEKIKASVIPILHRHHGDILVGAIILLVGLGGFGLGRLSAAGPSPFSATLGTSQDATVATAVPATSTAENDQPVVASKTGSRYHLPDCPGALKISDGNKVWFASRADAEKAGYTPAANCKGL